MIHAQDGTDYEYVTEKAKPTKIRNGFNANSVKQLFSIDPKSRLGTPEYQSTGIYASLASIEGYLVVCLGDGSTPFYIHGTTAEKLGEINLGSAEAASITSDEAGHMLIVNAVDKADSKLRIYRTSSVTAAPELFYEYANQRRHRRKCRDYPALRRSVRSHRVFPVPLSDCYRRFRDGGKGNRPCSCRLVMVRVPGFGDGRGSGVIVPFRRLLRRVIHEIQ